MNAERQVLLQYLQTGENVLSALKRLGKVRPWAHAVVEFGLTVVHCQEEDKTAFSAVTEAADRLLQAGHFDVYQDTLETIQRALGAVHLLHPVTCDRTCLTRFIHRQRRHRRHRRRRRKRVGSLNGAQAMMSQCMGLIPLYAMSPFLCLPV